MLRTVFIVFVVAALSATPSIAATTVVSRPSRAAKPHGHGHAPSVARSGAHAPTSRTEASHAQTSHVRSGRAQISRSQVSHSQISHSATARTSQHPAFRSHAHVSAVRPSSHVPSYHLNLRQASAPIPHTSEPSRRAPDPQPDEPLPPPAQPTAEGVSLQHARPAPMLAPLRGSLESLERQNEINDAEGLERILDDDDLNDRIARKVLVPVPTSASLAINAGLPENRRYCRPWTALFLADIARAHAARFGEPIEVSSAVRTVEYQKELMLTNGNAAAAEGDIVSPHVTGATVDIAKGTMSRQELGWMRSWLLKLQLERKIDVEEEFQQACFHITVYKNYVPLPSPPGKRHPRRSPSHLQSGVQVASSGN